MYCNCKSWTRPWNKWHHAQTTIHLLGVSSATLLLPFFESILACLLAADSSIFILGMPEATAFAIPPISSICTVMYVHFVCAFVCGWIESKLFIEGGILPLEEYWALLYISYLLTIENFDNTQGACCQLTSSMSLSAASCTSLVRDSII